MQNRQSKFLHGVDLEAIGFIGLTECYDKSIEMLNRRFGVDIPLRRDNRGKRSLDAVRALSLQERAELEQLNERDIALYKRAAALFEARRRAFQDDDPWAHARLVDVGPQRVAGWAWWAGEGDEPVKVEVLVNDEAVGQEPAVHLRPNLSRLLPPRGGYVGFHLPLKLSPGDRVQCRVAATGQCFPLKPRRVPAAESA